MRRLFILSIFVMGAFAAATCAAQEYVRPYDGAQAGLDSYRYGEAQRQANINRQLGAIEQIRLWRGLPPRWGGYDPRYEYWGSPFGPYRGPGYFEIWGRNFDDYGPQPIGRREVQTGPNRWESHPVYPEDQPARGPREF